MKKQNVGIAEMKVASAPKILTILGLGSCVAVAIYHEKSKTGGLVHVMLPHGEYKNGVKPGKYANTGIVKMYERMRKKVGEKEKMIAKIAGGSSMFKMSNTFNIGVENVQAVKQELKKLGIRIVGEDCGKNFGRNITFNPEDGSMRIKSIYGVTVI